MKTQIQKLKSSKLFYNKWPYKVECTIFGAYLLGRYKLSSVKDWCNGTGELGQSYGAKNINKGAMLVFVTAVEKFLSSDRIQIRTERSKFNLFCKDKDVLEEIENTLGHWIRAISGPTTTEELEYMLANGHKKRLCDALPKGKYQYKLFFKIKLPDDRKEQFLIWSSKYQDKICVSKTTTRWLKNERFYPQDPFMYVDDDKMLSMAGMFLSGYVKKVEHFILRNTVLSAHH